MRATAAALAGACLILFFSAGDLRAGTGAPPETLSVAQCIARARAQAPSYLAAGLTSRAASKDSLAARSNGRPDVAFLGGAWLAPEWSYDPAFTNLGEYHAQLSATWALTDGAHRRRERERAAAAAGGAGAQAALAQREAGELAAELALHAVRLDEVSDVLAHAHASLADIGALVRMGVRSGARSPADSIRLGLAEVDQELDAESVRSESIRTRLELSGAMGMPVDAEFTVRAPEEPARSPAGESAAQRAADSLAVLAQLEHRPELKAARAELAAAQLDQAEAVQRKAPALDLTVDAGLAGTDLTRAVPPSLLEEQPGATVADRLRRDLGASAAVNFKWPLSDPGRSASLDARRASVDASAARVRLLEETQRRDALTLLERARSARVRLDRSEEIVQRAEAHYLRTRSLYTAGATTLFDLLDAVQLHRDAGLKLAEAKEEWAMTRFLIEDRR